VLRFTSCQAEVAESFCKTLAIFVGQRLGIPTEFVGEIPWQERERLLDRGDIHVSWICGLPYVRKGGYEKAPVELLAAPVMKRPRYCARPVYIPMLLYGPTAPSCLLRTCVAQSGPTMSPARIAATTSSAIISRPKECQPLISAELSSPVLITTRYR